MGAPMGAIRASDRDRAAVQLPDGVVKSRVLAVERALGIGQRQAMFVNLAPNPVGAGIRNLNSCINTPKKATAARMRFRNHDVVNSHGGNPLALRDSMLSLRPAHVCSMTLASSTLGDRAKHVSKPIFWA